MSGIAELTAKMKTKMNKMTLDDLPSPTQKKSSERNDTVHTAVQPTVQLQEQQSIHTGIQPAVQQYSNSAKPSTSQASQILEKSSEGEGTREAGLQQHSNTATQDTVQQYSNTAEEGNSNNSISFIESNSGNDSQKNTATQYYSNNRNTAIQQNKTSYGRKVTLYMTEDMYKAFNDIYAQRMIEGRKTEKSALICEAVELLKRNEKLR